MELSSNKSEKILENTAKIEAAFKDFLKKNNIPNDEIMVSLNHINGHIEVGITEHRKFPPTLVFSKVYFEIRAHEAEYEFVVQAQNNLLSEIKKCNKI